MHCSSSAPREDLYVTPKPQISPIWTTNKYHAQYIPPKSILTQHALLNIHQIKWTAFAHSMCLIRWRDLEDCKGKKSWDSLSAETDTPLVFQYFLQVVQKKSLYRWQKSTLELCQQQSFRNIILVQHDPTSCIQEAYSKISFKLTHEYLSDPAWGITAWYYIWKKQAKHNC